MSKLPKELRLFLIVSAVLNVIAIICGFVARLMKLAPLYQSMPDKPRGWDLNSYLINFANFHHYSFFSRPTNFIYPPAVAPFYLLFFHVPHPRSTLELFILVIFALGAYLLGKRLVDAGLPKKLVAFFLTASLVMSYPIFFEWRQCNMEIFAFIALSLAVVAFCRNRNTTAAIYIGVAAAMKLAPFVFVGLFFAKKRIKPIFVVAIASLIATALSVAYITPSITYSLHGIAAGLDWYRERVMLHTIPLAIGWDHSAFTLVKLVGEHVYPTFHQRELMLRAYLLLVASLGTYLYFARIRHLPISNQVLCLSLAANFLPPSSFDYTLMALYIPWAMLVLFSVQRWKKGEPSTGLISVFLCFAVLLACETELIHGGRGLGGQVKACAGIVLFALALRYPFPLDGEQSEVTQRADRQISLQGLKTD